MALVLTITSDPVVGDIVWQALRSSHHAVTLCRDYAAAVRALLTLNVDVVCLDMNTRDASLNDFWRWLHADGERRRLPVLFLLPATMRWTGTPEGFHPGTDDVAFMPLAAGELRQKLESLVLAQGEREPAASRRFLKSRSGAFTLDSERLELWAEGKSVRLTPLEFRLFTYLMERAGRTVSLNELLEKVWGFVPGTGGPEVVRTHVSNLRRKLKAFGDKALLLQTVPHRGYRLCDGPPHS